MVERISSCSLSMKKPRRTKNSSGSVVSQQIDTKKREIFLSLFMKRVRINGRSICNPKNSPQKMHMRGFLKKSRKN